MAEQVVRVRLQAIVDGLQGFDQFSGAIKKLQGAIGPTDQQLEKARRDILAFGEANKQTVSSIEAQVNALRALRAQAGISGEVYRQIDRDISGLSRSMEEAGRVTRRVSSIILTSIPAKTPEGIQRQIDSLRQLASEAERMSDRYIAANARIQGLQRLSSNIGARENLVFANKAAEDRQLQSYGDRYLNEIGLPNTNAALAQRIQEVSDRLSNLTRGTDQWRQSANELKRLTKEAADGFKFMSSGAMQTKQRIEEMRRTMQAAGGGFAAWSQNATALTDEAAAQTAIQKSIERNRRKRGLVGDFVIRTRPLDGTPYGPEAPSELFRTIGGISSATAANQGQLMKRSYSEIAASIREVSRESDGSINSLRAQKSAWEALRNTLGDNKAALRETKKELDAIDRQLEKRGAGGGGNRIGRGLQAFGAVASGSIFGGPEGGLGALAGAAVGSAVPGLGTVAGAFAGAAIGAQVNQIRQAATATGEFYAEVQKLNIALRSVAGSASEYAKAQQVIALAQVELNVPIKETTQSFTQLTAAVKGAGGNVGDSEIVFRGVSEAIKATGGSAEDVQGAIIAMAQIFSKGKVSAEELQGQLGERLPGAVTIFAQATGRTLPQLQKDLQDGVVSLNDVMKFAAELSKRYGESASIMATSTEDSTARMNVSLDKLKFAFGSIVKPITTSIQSIISQLADMTTSALQSIGAIKQASSELGAAGRAKDLQSRAIDARNALGSNDQSMAEKRRAFELTGVLLQGVTRQSSLVGVKQNIQALQQARAIIRDITAEGLSDEQINKKMQRAELITKLLDQETAKLKTLQANSKPTQFQQNAGGKTDKERAAEERRAAAAALAAATQEQQLQESLAKARIALDDAVFNNAVELIRRRYELENELLNKQRENWVKGLTGAARGAGSLIAGFLGEVEQLNDRVLKQQDQVSIAQQNAKSAKAMAAATVSPSVNALPSGGGAIFGSTGNVNNAPGWVHGHMQSFGTAGELISTATDVIKKLLAQGIKVYINGAGDLRSNMSDKEIRAAVEAGRAAHTHSGDGRSLDVFVPKGTKVPVPLADVASMGKLGGIGGMVSGTNVAIMHLDPSSKSGGGRLAAGVAAAQRRDVSAEGQANIANAELQQSQKIFGMEKEQVEKLKGLVGEGFVLDFTEQIRQQNSEMSRSVSINELRNRLQLEGQRPEFIEGEIKKAEVAQRIALDNQTATEALKKLTAAGEGESIQAQRIREGIAANNAQLAEFTRLTDDATRAQIAFNDAMRLRQDDRIGLGIQEGAKQYIESIGTMREATARLTQEGIKGVEDALFELATTGTTNFRQFAADILRQTTRMIIQQMVLRNVMMMVNNVLSGVGGGIGGAVGGLFSGTTAGVKLAFSSPSFLANGGILDRNGLQPFAMGGIVTKPTIFRYANGGVPGTGLMGEAGPEAIIPLRRGADGRLGVSGGGGGTNNTSVTVNVDASGSNVQGDSNKGEQLGRAVSQAVQDELLRQKRPGGLLAA